MFTVYHFVWLAVCAALIAGALIFLKKRRPPLKNVLSVCCVLCVASELVKDLSVIKMVPSADGSMLLPYMEMQHLPFHLCSIQILLIFFVRFARPGKARTTVLAFMYPTALIGAAASLLCTVVVGALTFFMKKTLTSLEEADKRNAEDIKALDKNLNDLKADLPLIYVTREDYIRVMNRVEDKLDQILYGGKAKGKEE